MFGCASYGEIKNITVSTNEGKKISGSQFVGGICGASFCETFTNCISNCTVNIGSNSNAGGIVGVDKGFSTVNNCENTGAISGKGSIGGIMGTSNIGSKFTGCKNFGKVTGSKDNIGGICGNGGVNYTDCENHGVISSADNKTNIGGIVGYVTEDFIINNCINSGDIIINGTDAKYIGGIVGHTSKTLTLTNCLNLGQIKGNSNVGGIIGFNECTKIDIANAFNAGEISGHGIIGSINNQTSTCTSCVNIGKATASKYCIFDKQMCTGSGNAEDGKLTSEMLGDGVKSKLGTAHWTFTDGMYPMITTLKESDYMKVAATPLILKSDNDSENVKNNFTVGTANEAEWICNDAETVSFSEDGKGYITNPDLDETVEVYVTIKKVTKAIPLTILHRDGLTSPTITWERATEEDIYYGTKVSAEMIKANVQEEYKNDGTIKCNISENEVLHAGHYILTATFVPSEDNENTLASVTTIKTLDVLELEAAPFISWEPQDIIYGAENSDYSIKNATAIDGEGNPIEGDFFYEIPPLTVKKDENGELKKQTVSLFFIGTNYITYSPIEKEILVSPAKPAIAWAEPAAIDYGTALSELQLGAVAGVEGTFTYYEVIDNNDVALPDDGILNAGTHTLKAVFDANSENYADGESMTVHLVVNKLKPEITWEPETAFAELNYGETLDEDAFYASVDDEFDNFGSLSYFENNEAIDIWSVLPAGTHTITAKFEPSNDNYDNNTAVATIKINKATPVITWLSTDEERTVKYGTALSATQLNASVEPADAGTVRFAFDAAGTIDAMGAMDRDAGTCAVYAIIDESDNYNSAQISKDIVIGKADLDITWDPQGFTYGATSEEIASAVETAEISFNEQALTDGTFIYTYPSPLNAGDNQDVSVKFVPNSTNFNNAEDTKPINIAKATPEIVWEPQNVTYGASSEEIAEALKNAEAKFKGVSVNGDYNYTLPLTTDLQVGLEEGELIAAVIFTPTGDDAINFEEASAIVNVVVDKADPTITWEIADEDKTFTYGTALSDKQLNATTNAEGEIVYTDGETEIAIGDILDAGPHTITATLAESDNYNEATETITITVNPAESEITWETPATIAYGTPISAVELNATANTEGTFTYTLDGADAEGLTPNVGSYTITANFTPASTNYKEATATVTLKVASAAAEITWATPEAITYGTALSDAQLNATSEIDGDFFYTPAKDAIIPAGDSTLSVVFIPASSDYGRAVASVKLTVNKAELKVSVADTTVKKGDAKPEFKLVYDGFIKGEDESVLISAPTATCTATTDEVGEFEIVVSGAEAENYNITYTNGKMTVVEENSNPGQPAITWADPTPITYGALIDSTILNATANVAGTFKYSVNAGDALKVGSYELVATFTPANGAEAITDTVTLVVNKAKLTVSVADVIVNQGDDMPSFSVDCKGFVLGEDISVLTAIPNAKCNATTDKAGTFDIVVSGGEAENYSFEYKNGKLTVNKKNDSSAITDNEVKISVYPNPTTDVLFVETETEVDFIYVYNMTGKLVLTEANVGKTRIDLANEPQGTYFVKVGDKTIKVLKF